MNYQINEDLENFITHSQYSLISHKSFSCINKIAKFLPSFSTAILECRLDDNEHRVDLAINLIGKSPVNFNNKLLKFPEWKFFQKIYIDWLKQNSLLYKNVQQIWLEFDLEEQALFIPVPCIFFGIFVELNKETFNNQNLIKISSRLLNSQLSSSFESNLKYCINCLPTKAKINHFGVMLSRSEQTLRIVSKIQSNLILDYLKKIGWSGSEKNIESLLLKLSEFTATIVLSYDVGETIMPRIGLECYLPKPPKYKSRLKLLLNYLVELNLCSESKRDALLNWSGYLKKTSKSSSFFKDSDTLEWKNIFFKQKEPTAFIRTISHIKVVYNFDNSLEAKAYLQLCHEPIDLII
ncbi:MAG: hypothetical protein MUD14_24680 [Hydrococcus sp. Prado102]|nr:hypothetical protein [Hydrococcus sp. Prado102]